MSKKRHFTAKPLILIFACILVIILSTYYVWTTQKPKATVTKQPTPITVQPNAKPVDPYEGWGTYCDTQYAKGCFRYPSDWVVSQYGGFENTAKRTATR